MRVVFNTLLALILLALSSYGFLVWQNNRDTPAPSQETLQASLEKSIQWMESHADEITGIKSAILWRMVQQSAELTGDERLRAVFSRYKSHLPRNSPWQYLFDPKAWVPFRPDIIAHLPDYNQHIIYAASCDNALGQTRLIQQQLSADFCPEHHPISPACSTHQLMGMHMMMARSCGKPEEIKPVISSLQDTITSQLTWDPRVVDVYLQRALMLHKTGVGDRVKNQWLQNIVDAQLNDGGWSGSQPLISLGDSLSLGFTARFIDKIENKSDFHATAQGVLLMSILTTQTE